MIVVTGGIGFIGKNVIKRLLELKCSNVIYLDTRIRSLNSIYIWLTNNANQIDGIFHFGANTNTTETNQELLFEHNVGTSMFIWNLCTEYQIPLVYASSAATYGDGEFGFDDEKKINNLKPLNLYGWSKHNFDTWCELEEKTPPYWYGLKFFNVYGHGEKNKGKMASMIYQIYNQIKNTGKVNLFESNRLEYCDGEQVRDFIYIDDVVDVCIHMMTNLPKSGIYNVGTGKSRSFNDVARVIFNKLEMQENISYIEIPNDIKNSYQYFTEAKINKLRNIGYCKNFNSLEEGIEKYIKKLENENR